MEMDQFRSIACAERTRRKKNRGVAHRKRYCFNMVIAVTTLTGRPCDNAWS
jgi:hypothetical protein